MSLNFIQNYFFIQKDALDNNQQIFVYEDDDWMVKGRFETAKDDVEPIQWTVQDNKYILPILLVSFIIVGR